METSYIEKIIPFIANMRIGVSEDEPTPSYPEGVPFVDGQNYSYIYYNKSLSIDYINSILENLEYTEGEGGAYTILINGTKDGDEWMLLSVSKVDLSMIGQTGFAYMISSGDESGAIMDGCVYLSQDIRFEGPDGEEVYEKGWHTTTQGQIVIEHQPIKNSNQWDKIKTIFSSEPFEA